MSYKTDLQGNNVDLQSILDAVNELPEAVGNLPTLDNPAVDTDLLTGKEMIDKYGNKVTGAMPEVTPTVSVHFQSKALGKVIAIAQYTDGHVSEGYAVSKVAQLPTQEAKVVTPGTTEQIAVEKQLYTIGDVTVAGDANLVPENIVKGKSIFGVEGNADMPSSTETWTFKMKDGTTVTKEVVTA